MTLRTQRRIDPGTATVQSNGKDTTTNSARMQSNPALPPRSVSGQLVAPKRVRLSPGCIPALLQPYSDGVRQRADQVVRDGLLHLRLLIAND